MKTYPFKVNLFVIGSRKGGTSALKTLLAHHPLISMSDIKEPGHFLPPTAPTNHIKKQWQDADAYHALFDYHESINIYGEASTTYSMRHLIPGVPERIRAYNPDAKFIYMVREPVARMVSHYLQDYRSGGLQLSMTEAISRDRTYIETSDYVRQITPFLELFPRENIKILVAERLKKDPQIIMRDLHEWLGVDHIAPPEKASDQANNVTPRRVGRPRKAYTAIRNHTKYTRAWRNISKALPAGLKEAIRPILYSDRVKSDEVPYNEIVRLVGPEVDRIKRETRELLDDTLPEWD
ncbi:MAG: sulfotransferase family protein [Alphaproteobacteria bacterium]